MSFQTELHAFFERYVDAFARNDASAVVELWEPIGLFPSPNGNFAMERDKFREHCVSLMDFYRSQGVVRTEGKLLEVNQLFPDVAEARMAYCTLDEAGDLVAEWEHFYILRRTDDWRVTLTIADDEMAAWTARGAQL